MKKLLCLMLIFLASLTCGITLLLPKVQNVQAEIVGTDGAQFVLTGYSGMSPTDYFTDSNGKKTLENAQVKSPDKNYVNKKGESVNKYNYITGKHTSLSNAKSSGYCEIYPSVQMQKIISAGQMQIKASCGLLALKDEERSKVNIKVEIIAGGGTFKTLTLTSDKVSSNSSEYEPDWVETKFVSLPTNTEKVVFWFESREETNRIHAAKFCIFEPTVFFATNLNECTMLTQSQSLKVGQVLKLSATNMIFEQDSSYFDYYKDIHKISFEITSGKSYAKIVGSYLYVNSNAPTGAKIAVRAKCRKSSMTGEYIYSKNIIFMLDVPQTVLSIEKDFSSPAIFYGEGKYFVGDTATVSYRENEGFEFVCWQKDGETVSTSRFYSFKVDGVSKIKAVFVKTIQISSINIKTKVYDGTKDAQIESVILSGVENEHDVQVLGLSANFVSSSAGEQKAVELNSVPTLCGDDSNLYNLDDFVPTTTGSILQKTLEIRADAKSKTYGESDPKLTFSSNGLIDGESVDGTLGRNAGEKAGEYEINAGNLVLKNPNYKIDFFGAKFVVERREIELQEVGVAPKIYDQTTDAQIFATEKNIVFGDDVKTCFQAEFVDANVGSGKQVNVLKIELVGADSDNYYVKQNISTLLGSISCKKIDVVAKGQTLDYGEQIKIEYEASGLIGSDKLEGELQIASNQVGRYLILIGTLNNLNYEINLASDYIEIVPKKIVVRACAASKTYGDEDLPLKYSVQGLVSGDTLFGTLQREKGENAGIYQIEIGSLYNDNYDIDFVQAQFEIKKRVAKVEFLANDKTYDGTTNVQFSYELTNLVSGDEITVEADLKFQDKNVDNHKQIVVNKIEAFGEKSSNYDLIYDQNAIFASISAKKVQIITKSAQKIYGDDDPSVVVEMIGLVEGDGIVGDLQRTLGEDVGKYYYGIPQTMRIQNSNYELSMSQETTLEIVPKKIDISTLSAQKQFGDVDPTIEYSFTAGDFAFNQTFEELKKGDASREVGEEIGRYNYKIGSLSFGDNYQINFIQNGMFTITKRDVQIEVETLTKVYGESDPTLTFKQSNFVEGVWTSIKLKRETGENVGTYKITYESLDDPHYNIEFFTGELNILPCEISIRVEDTFKYYGQPDPSVEFVLYSGALQLDDELNAILKGEISREPGEDVGDYIFGQGTLNAGENYKLTFISGKLSILAQSLFVKIKDAKKFYGESDPTFEYEILSGDKTVLLLGKMKRVFGENVGEYAIEPGTLAASSNYTLKFDCGTLSILPRKITVTALSVSKVYGELDPQFDYQITMGSLIEPNDLSGKIYRENVGNKIYENAGTYPLLSSLSNPNYEIDYVEGELTILQREIVVSTQNRSSIYGEEIASEFDYSIDGQILEGDTLTGGLYKAQGQDAGKYPIRCNINLGRNYKVKYIQAYYEILPRQLVVTFGENQKTYSNPDPSFSLEILEGELIDGDELNWEVERESCEDVGVYELKCKSQNSNYQIKTKDSVLSVTQKNVNLSFEVLDKVYDGTSVCKIKNPVVSGLVDNEIMLDYDKNNCAKFVSIEPANNIKIEILDFRLVGSKAANYNLILPTGLVANITYSALQNKNVQISTYNSTAMKFGTVLNIKELRSDGEFNGKKVVQNLSVGLLDSSGNTLALDNALDMKIGINKIGDLNNIHVYGKNLNGEYVEIAYKISGENIIVSTSTFLEFVVVCDNENWIDIALAVCAALILGTGVFVLFFNYKKKKKQAK